MLICFFPPKEQPCTLQPSFFAEKKHNKVKRGRKRVLLELVFDWCISIRILMRQVYINPVFSKFGTANLLLSAKPSPFGQRFFLREVFCCVSTVLFRTKSSPSASLTVLLRTNPSCTVATVLLGTTSSVFGFNCSFQNNFVRGRFHNDILCRSSAFVAVVLSR